MALETEDDIRYCVTMGGEPLDFGGAIINGILGQLTYNIQNYDSIYDIEQQDFNIRVFMQDIVDNSIETDQTCTYTVFNRVFTFKIIKIIEDGTGWGNMKVVLVKTDTI